MTGEPVEVVSVLAPSRRSTPAQKKTETPTKPISEQADSMAVEHEQDDPTSEPTKNERLPVAVIPVDDPHVAEANPALVTCGAVNYGVEAEVKAVFAGAQVWTTPSLLH